MILYDVFENKGFFTAYNELKPAHFLELFPDITSDDIIALNNLLLDVYGDRVLTSRYEIIFNKNTDDFFSRIISNIDTLHFDNWKKTQSTIISLNNENALTGYKEIRETENNRQNENLNKVYSYDNDLPVNDNGNNSTTDFMETVTINKTGDKTKIENVKEFIDFTRNNQFLDIMLYDIVDTLTLGIF